jgi:hypothetical protein
VPAVSIGVPSLSQIAGWDTEHLESAARTWSTTAEHWEETFTAVHRGSLSPGGTIWEGEGAEAAQQRTFADLVKVRGLSDQLFNAAEIARRGADQLGYLKRMALAAVDDARTAGFDVGEDLSVSDRSLVPLGPAFAARQAQAQTLAAEIRLRAAALSAADHEIATKITAATAPLSGVAFDEEPAEKTTVQAVDNHTVKESPPDHPGGDRPWQEQPSPRTYKEVQDALRQLRRGENKPHRELDTPEEIREFWDWLTGNSAGHAPSNAPFPRERLDDGTIISFRPDSESGGETIGVTAPSGKETKVHLPLAPPIISGPPQLPPLADHPQVAPPWPGPAGPAPAVLPPWLQSPALHGTPIPSQGPTIMPGIPLPASPPPATPTPVLGPALLPQIGHDIVDAGEKVVAGGLIGVAIIGGLLGIGPGASPVTR